MTAHTRKDVLKMAKEILLTQEGLEELQAELHYLKTVKSAEIEEKIEVARGYGDLSENSEYDEAKSEQGKIYSRINEIEAMLQNYRLIDESEASTDVVGIGSKVKLRDMELKEDFEYTIVGFAQADPDTGKLSDESPIGKAILGHKKGEKIQVEAPIGTITFKIVSINK